MRHGEWFNKWKQEQTATKQTAITPLEVEAEFSTLQTVSKPKNNGNFHKADCAKCGKETWHYIDRGALNPKAHCCDCTKPNTELVAGSVAVIAQLTPIHEAPTEGQLQAMNKLDHSLWNGKRKQRGIDLTNYDWADDVFPSEAHNEALADPDKAICTFCKKPTDQIKLTSEKKPRIRIEEVPEADSDGKITMRRRVLSMVEELHACPDCVLEIRNPIIVRTV